MKWTVRTMGETYQANGDTAADAAKAALKAGAFKKLGVLMSAYPTDEGETEENTYYMSSVRMCKAAGVFSDENAVKT